jgi:hypothetical protein
MMRPLPTDDLREQDRSEEVASLRKTLRHLGEPVTCAHCGGLLSSGLPIGLSSSSADDGPIRAC